DMADQGDQLALSTGLDPQDAEAVLGVMVRDAFDQTGEHLAIRWRGLPIMARSPRGVLASGPVLLGANGPNRLQRNGKGLWRTWNVLPSAMSSIVSRDIRPEDRFFSKVP